MPQSLTFWCVLFASAALHWLLPQRMRAGFIAIVSVGYLATLDPIGVAIVCGWSLIFYRFTPAKDAPRARATLTTLVLAALGFLAIAKYLPGVLRRLAEGFGAQGLLVTLGVSYYTFKMIHYAVERRRGNLPPHTLSDFACYTLLMPTFTAGPIERFDHFMRHRKATLDHRDIVEGLTRIVHGLVKKFVVAAALLAWLTEGLTPETAIANPAALDTGEVWRIALASFLGAYLDFSAYSDIAIGGARLYGITIMENFNWPILARSLPDLWRRWHMTLVNWCQSYVYMPMIGLTRNPYLAIYATFGVMAMWHEASLLWLCWGIYQASGVAIHLRWTRWQRSRGLDLLGGRRGWIGTPLVIAWMSFGTLIPTIDRAGGSFYDVLTAAARMIGLHLPA